MIASEEFGSPYRRLVLLAIVAAACVVLFGRLIVLQLLYHEELGKKSDENSVRTLVKEPVRGYMFDRNGRLIVDVGPAFSVTVTPSEFDTLNYKRLAALLDLELPTLRDRVAKGRAYSRFSPVRVKRDVDFRTLSSLEENLFMLPGVSYEVESKRTYTGGQHAAHLLGYCKEISDAQFAKLGAVYRQGDVIGSSGLEASYETFLRGEKGFEFFSVNAKGQSTGPLESGKRDVLPKEGFDLILSLDYGLQAYAESLMTPFRGALVALDPHTGGILAAVSKPDFNPEVFSGVTSAEEWNALNNDPAKPLFNRATQTRYPPGSTFKMLLALAALQEGVIDEQYEIKCTGGFRFGNRLFKDTHVHGQTDIIKSIQQSCNVFYNQLILKVGLDLWASYCRMFGFGKSAGFDLPEETTGLVPTSAYYDRVYGPGRWTQGNLVSLGIGQGELGVSPLQMARYVATLANKGTLVQPHAVNYVRNKQSNRLEAIDYKSTKLPIKEEYFDIVREAMRRCVQVTGGTGMAAGIPGIESAGKTGTAENPHGGDHSWFVGFAPFENPQIAIAVLVENVGFGASYAAPIAGLVNERYLKGEVKRSYHFAPPKRGTSKDSTASITQALAH
jgi:penicillin-binding protein 2